MAADAKKRTFQTVMSGQTIEWVRVVELDEDGDYKVIYDGPPKVAEGGECAPWSLPPVGNITDNQEEI